MCNGCRGGCNTFHQLIRNKYYLLIGLLLLGYSLLCPLFLTDRTLGIYETYRIALHGESLSALFVTVLKLILLNCMRSIPIYLGAFLLAESLSAAEQFSHWSLFRRLLPLMIIPAIYYLVFPIYGIRYDFGMPALILVTYVLILSHLNLFSVSIPQKIITFVIPFIGMQFLDVTPGLTNYGFGRGEISSDIKIAALIMGGEPELTVYCLTLFSVLLFCSILHFQLLLREHRIQIAAAQSQKVQDELYQTRLEALRMRSSSEAQSLVHDLKTPLTTIQLLVGLSAMMEENPLIQDYLERISNASENMSIMISDILHEDHLTATPVEEFVRLVLASASVFLPSEVLVVSNQCPKGTMVRINRIRMIRAIVNILENAWKAVGQKKTGRIVFTVQKEDGWIRFQVADNGIGIENEQLQHIFDIGWSNMKSTGLGLNYVKHMVEAHGGRIQIQSTPMERTVVTISIKEATNNGR